jgi:hypothetical protein
MLSNGDIPIADEGDDRVVEADRAHRIEFNGRAISVEPRGGIVLSRGRSTSLAARGWSVTTPV